MENFKINLFNDKKLKEKYKELNADIEYKYTDRLDLYKYIYDDKENNNKTIKLTYIFNFLQKIDKNTNNNKSLYDACFNKDKDLSYNCILEHGFITKENEVLKICTKKQNIKYKKIDFHNEEDVDLYLASMSEYYYGTFCDVGGKANGYSGVITEDNGYIKTISFIYLNFNRETFIKNTINSLEGLLDKDSDYSLNKIEKKILNEIEFNDNEFGTEGKKIKIALENRNDNLKRSEITLVLLLLHFKGLIYMHNDRGFFNDVIYIDLIGKNSNKGVYFNKGNGDVSINGIKIGSINLNTQEFYFFEFLYDNIGVGKTHKEIKEAIVGNQYISGTSGNYLSGIKKKLEKPIKDLIFAHKGTYLLK